MYMAILGRQSFKALRTVQDFHFRSRGIIVGRMRKTSCIKSDLIKIVCYNLHSEGAIPTETFPLGRPRECVLFSGLFLILL
jgi:hypothetical protein